MSQQKHINKTIVFVSIITALAGLLFGFDTGIISGALLFIQQDFHASIRLQELIVASALIGAIIGSLASGRLTDKYGRRGIIIVISLIFIIGTLIASLAVDLTMIVIGRIFIGIAIGIGSYTAPLYIAEAAPFELRGGLVSLNQLMITIGIMVSYFINYAFADMHGTWRLMFIIGVIPATLLGLGMLILPESARWLVKENKIDEASKTLKYFRQSDAVAHELQEIKVSLKQREKGFKDLFAKWIRPVLFVGVMLGFLQQVTGINTIIYYAPKIFLLAGFHSTLASILATAGVGVVNVLITAISLRFIDTLGRRILLLIGIAGMGISLFFLSYAFHQDLHSAYLSLLTLISVFVYIACFAFSLGTMLWLLVAEIFPLEIRGAGMGVAVASCWFWNLVISSTFLSLLHALGASDTFLIYAIMCVLGFILCYSFVPETKGVSLETIEENIHNGLFIREIGAPVKAKRNVSLPEVNAL